ncbi:CLUMA_CG016816, isoform A [Clunio marinus]|uniref:CLUMA_CG016816, isoform A n=1 Tax=Clunio marinus TaxID=568069 RepID=A0A1J1ISF8_9DIPT|nr:CLUMA_CG016816, isoform A [Clunio marinus]
MDIISIVFFSFSKRVILRSIPKSLLIPVACGKPPQNLTDPNFRVNWIDLANKTVSLVNSNHNPHDQMKWVGPVVPLICIDDDKF